jgi:hypothetical protein
MERKIDINGVMPTPPAINTTCEYSLGDIFVEEDDADDDDGVTTFDADDEEDEQDDEEEHVKDVLLSFKPLFAVMVAVAEEI